MNTRRKILQSMFKPAKRREVETHHVPRWFIVALFAGFAGYLLAVILAP